MLDFEGWKRQCAYLEAKEASEKGDLKALLLAGILNLQIGGDSKGRPLFPVDSDLPVDGRFARWQECAVPASASARLSAFTPADIGV